MFSIPRFLLQIFVFFALSTPFVFLFQNNAQAFSPKEEAFIEETAKKVFSQKELSSPFYGYKSTRRGDFLRWVINNSEINLLQFSDAKTPFIDISSDEPISEYVSNAYVLGALHQFEKDKKFLKNKKITRLQAVQILIDIEGISLYQDYSNGMEAEWNDLPNESFEKNIILVAIQKGLLKGDENNFIYPNNPLSRTDALWMLYVYNSQKDSSSENNKRDENSKFETLQRVEHLVETQYWHTGEIDLHQLEDAAVSGVVDSLDDDYSVYFPPEQAEKFTNYINEEGDFEDEEYAGLGVVVQGANEGGMVITQVFDGSPAEISDIRVGDVVIEVNGENVQELSVSEIAKKIKGPVGTSASLSILRGNKKITKRFIRKKIFIEDLSSVTTEIVDGIVWIKVRAFKSFTAKDFRKALEENVKDNSNIRGVIVDLRYNPGGLMNAAQEMLGEVLPDGSIAVRLYSNFGEEVFYVNGSNDYTDIPLVIFQNEYSASASEIFSASIQDYERGEIIGTTSYGKGIAQTLFTLKRGSLKLTTAEFRSPLQNVIHKIGISPDIKLHSQDDASYLYEAKKIFR